MSFDKRLFDENFTFGFRASVSNNFNVATRAFEEFWKGNSVFLRDADDLYGRILYYAVNLQFKNASTKTASAFLVTDSLVTKYKNKAVFLNTDDYVTGICRTEKPNKLPSTAKYKLDLAKGNQSENNQFEFDFTKAELNVGRLKKYAIIGYRYLNGNMKHLNIIVPDSEFKSILFSQDLMGNVIEAQKYVPEELINDQVSELKNDIVVKLKEDKII